MSLDFERVAFGIFLAVALPRSLPRMSSPLRSALGAVVALYAALPLGNSGATYLLIVGSAAVAGMPRTAKFSRPTRADIQATFDRIARAFRRRAFSALYVTAIGLLIAGLVVVAALASDPPQLIFLKLSRLIDNDTAIVIFGALNAAFVSNLVVRIAVSRPLRTLERAGEDIGKLLPTSQLVGQLERFVVFSLVAGGQSDAAAIAIAIKSIVRVPEARRHKVGFVEYFLVGTLASVGVSLLNAVIVRLLLGQAPL